MYAQQALPFGEIAHNGDGYGTVAGFCETGHAAPRFIRSVVEEAGLSRFVYLQGCSGRRYVFSAIRPEQVGLYEKAVFARSQKDGTAVDLFCATSHTVLADLDGNSIYVHLLAEEEDDSLDVIADLSGAMQ